MEEGKNNKLLRKGKDEEGAGHITTNHGLAGSIVTRKKAKSARGHHYFVSGSIGKDPVSRSAPHNNGLLLEKEEIQPSSTTSTTSSYYDTSNDSRYDDTPGRQIVNSITRGRNSPKAGLNRDARTFTS